MNEPESKSQRSVLDIELDWQMEILEFADSQPTDDPAIAQERERKTQALIVYLIEQDWIKEPLDSESISEQCRQDSLMLQLQELVKEIKVYSEPQPFWAERRFVEG